MRTEERTEIRMAYRSAGLRIASAISLDDMCTTTEPGAPDLTIEVARPEFIDTFAADTSFVTSVGEAGAPWLEVRRSVKGILARWPGQLDVVIPDGGRRMLVCERGPVADSIARLLLCQAMSFVLPWHGREGLHASAVEVDGKGVILAGGSGRGKSTLATALCRVGGRLLSDDLTSIRIQDGRVVVDPSTNRTWLWREVAEQVGDGFEDAGRAHKVTVASPRGEAAVPLVAMYSLGFRSGAPSIEAPITGVESVVGLLSESFNFSIRTPQRLTQQFAIATELAAQAHIIPLRWQPDHQTAAQLAEQIVHAVRSDEAITVQGAPMPSGSPSKGNGLADRRRLLEVLGAHGIEADVDGSFSEPLLRTSQVAALLRTTDRTVRTWAEAGKLTYIRTLGGRRLFPASGVVAVLETMRAHTRQEG